MSNVKNKIKRNMTKNLNNKKEKEDSLKKQIRTFIILIVVISLVVGAFFLKTYLDLKKEEASNSGYTEILAAQTFSKGSDTYYVVFYDFDSKEENLTTKLTELETPATIYKVNLKDPFKSGTIKSVAQLLEKEINDLSI